MDQERRAPSVRQIVWTDYVALLGLAAPIVGWGFYIATRYFGFFPALRGGDDPLDRSDAPFFLKMALVATAIGLPLILARVRSVQGLFARAVEVPGRITGISFFRDRGRVEYAYTYGDTPYHGGNAIHKTGRAKRLAEGQEVVLMVDPDSPGKALVRDLYV